MMSPPFLSSRPILLCLFFLCAFLRVTSYQPRVFYVSFTQPISKHPLPSNVLNGIDGQNLGAIMQSDDSPFVQIDLSWPFNYFGRNYYNAYVSPNGAIHMSIQQPCPTTANFGDLYTCGFNTSYYGLIGGYLTDLNPSQVKSGAGNITYFKQSDSVTVYFRNIPNYGMTLNHTFAISIFKDGHVDISYIHIHAPTSMTGMVPWLTGLRAPQYYSNVNYTNSQLQTGITQWSTTVPGIYPRKSSVVDGQVFTACPISTLWCAQPSKISLNNTVSSGYMNVTFTPLSLSCQSYIEFAIYIDSLPAAAYLFNSSSMLSICNSPMSSGNTTTITCNLNQLLSSRSAGPHKAYFAWRVDGSTTNFEPLLEVNPVTITTYYSPSSSPTTSPSPTVCSLNENVNLCSITNTSSCSVCNGQLGCLNLPCSKTSTSTTTSSSIYTAPSCNGTCESTTSSIDYYEDHIKKICCPLDSVDCLGFCYGSAKPGYTSSGSLTCCTTKVDCLGVCDGKAQRDACGVCQGSDKTGKTCHTYVDIDTFTSPNSLYPVIDIGNLQYNISTINITNTNSTPIYVSLSLSNKGETAANVGIAYIGPDVDYPRDKVTIPGFSSWSVAINTSFASIMSGRKAAWDVKTLTVTYSRPSVSDVEFNYAIDIFPAVKQCSIATRSQCLRLPGCIYCLDYPGIRVLRQAGDEQDEASSFVGGGIQSESRYIGSPFQGEDGGMIENINIQDRELYTNIMPDQVGVKTYSFSLGYCTNGWLSDVCPYSATSSATAAHFSFHKNNNFYKGILFPLVVTTTTTMILLIFTM